MVSSFYLIKPRITKTDIFYKIYIKGNQFYFIKVGGQFHNRYAYEKQLPELFELLFMFWFIKMEKKQENIEKEYDTIMSQTDGSNLLQKRPNFSLNVSEVKEIIISKKKTFHTGYHDNGTITFSLIDDKKVKFIIPKTVLRMVIRKCMDVENLSAILREE